MAFYSGASGYLYYDRVKAAKVQNWQFTSSLTTLDTTTLGDVDRTIVPGTRSISGTCRLFYYDYTSGKTARNDASALIRKLIKGNAGSTENAQVSGAEPDIVRFFLGFTDADGKNKSIVFYAYITSASMAMAVGEVMAADISFEGSGAADGLNL